MLDSSAAELRCKRPATVARMEKFCDTMKGLVRGDSVTYDDRPEPVQFDWTGGYELPVWVAAYGPKALAAAGRVGDALIVQLAEPSLCQWMGEAAKAAGGEAGRDMSGYRVMACAPVWVGDKAKGIAQTKWFPALVGNHIADILKWYGSDTREVPEALTAYVQKRKGSGADEGYDYSQHTQMDDENAYYVTDETTEAFCLIGPAEAHVEKLRRLEAAGVTQFNIYLCSGEEERQIAEYGEHVIPHFR